MEEKIIFCLLGKSAVGKDTLINSITYSNMNVTKVIPTTTRPMRHFEKNGHDYHFISRDSFMRKINKGQFMEYREYDITTKSGEKDKWYYGTTFPINKVSIITGSLAMYKSLIDNDNLKSFKFLPLYITIPEEERLFRMCRREVRNQNPNFKELSRRFFADIRDFSSDKLNELGVDDHNTFINIDKDKVVTDINEYINSILKKEGILK